MNALPYYPRYPRDFLEGTAGMSGELKGAYSVLLDVIMMMGERGLPDDPSFIAGHLGYSVRKWNLLRKQLIDAGKIQVANGLISNKRADKEKIIQRLSRDKNAENRRGKNKNNDLAERPSTYTEPDTDTVTNVTAEIPIDFEKVLFENGVRFLCEHGTPESSARALVAKWRKSHDDRDIFDAFKKAKQAGAIDPKSFIAKILGGQHGRPRSDERLQRTITAAAVGTSNQDWG